MGGNTVGKILWSSRLTNGSTLDTLPPEEYKIQYVGDSSDLGDPQLRTLFEKGLSHSHEWMCSSMTTRLIDDLMTLAYFDFDESIFQGYKIIFSNVDAWRMDCGFGSWIEGNEKCNNYAGANSVITATK